MSNFKNDFPIFKNNPNLIYFDSTASSQKPSYVIDWLKNYLENDYANIHRWAYSLSERSENLYETSKKKVASYIWANNYREIIYTLNSTYASNLLISSLKRSNYFKKWDKVLLSIVEHHANVVPWLILKEELWIEVDYIKVKSDFSLDFDDLVSKLDSSVKAVSITHVSNVTGEIFDLERVGKIISELSFEKPLFIVDWSQSVPHFKVDVQKIWCDFMFFTWHKVFADSGIWVLWWKEKILKNLKPWFSGGWAISWVKKDCFLEAWLPDRFEPGTQNLSWAVTLLKAFEYIDQIGWYEKMEEIEMELVRYFLGKFEKLQHVRLIWWTNPETRVWVFSFVVEWVHSLDIADYLAENDICVRAWQHCAEPFLWDLGLKHTIRASLYIYNDKDEIDRFFEVLASGIGELV
jgi:cysteine desulfurase/selenocysteine lyase